jgi:hypothetical protein
LRVIDFFKNSSDEIIAILLNYSSIITPFSNFKPLNHHFILFSAPLMFDSLAISSTLHQRSCSSKGFRKDLNPPLGQPSIAADSVPQMPMLPHKLPPLIGEFIKPPVIVRTSNIPQGVRPQARFYKLPALIPDALVSLPAQ